MPIVHYYFQPDVSANDAATNALRLRMTRSLWGTFYLPLAHAHNSHTRTASDQRYVDESWAGSNVQNHQPNGAAIWLIPRMKQLINDNYPGTKLSISEWPPLLMEISPVGWSLLTFWGSLDGME